MKKFKALAEKAIEGLPQDVKDRLRNVAVCIEPSPSKEQKKRLELERGEILLGLYEGVPETEWGKGFGGSIPDKITLFRQAIESQAGNEEELQEIIRRTIIHEFAHYFGYSDEELEEKER
ncbi:MAG: metallopeptidase family protein [Candidatus Yanofskybacteria bacterium]|nr:metallopeptidase family protein [Candidatus Yanofskybacteria bacterium]